MAAEMKVTDAAVEAAIRTYLDIELAACPDPKITADDILVPNDETRRCVAEMLRAGLAAMLDPVYQFGDASSDSEWFDGVLTDVSRDDFYKTRTLYRIKPE